MALTTSQLPGLDLWLKPSDDFIGVADGTAVTSITDHGPNSRTVVPDGTGAVVRANVHNGHPALDLSAMSGGNDCFKVASYFTGTPMTACTLYAVYSGDASALFTNNVDGSFLVLTGQAASVFCAASFSANIAVAGTFNILSLRYNGAAAGGPVAGIGSMLHERTAAANNQTPPTSITVTAGDLRLFNGQSSRPNVRAFELIWCPGSYHTDAQIAVVRQSLYSKYEDLTKPIVLCLGNSLVEGLSENTTSMLETAPSPAPAQLQLDLAAAGTVARVYNFGIGGSTAAQWAGFAPALIAPYLAETAGLVFVTYEGANEIGGNAASAATYVTDYAAWTNPLRAYGRVVASTIAAFAGQYDANRLAANAVIRAGYTTYAHDLADPGSTPHIANLSDTTNATYYASSKCT